MLIRCRRVVLPLLVGLILGAGVNLVWEPAVYAQRNALNTRITLDSSGSVKIASAALGAGAQSTRNLANTNLKLDSSGNLLVALSGASLFPDGTAALPSIAFSTDPASGFRLRAASIIDLSLAGATRIDYAYSGGNKWQSLVSDLVFGWSSGDPSAATMDTAFSRTSAGAVALGNGTAADVTGTLKFTTLNLVGKTATYNNATTAGMGHPAIYGYVDTAAATNTGTASIAAYPNPASDGTYEVGCNILVTTSTTHSFSCDVTYTDEGNTARTMVLPIEGVGGSFLANGLITNVTGVGPYESAVMTIRVKASTTITVRTSSGGTFTGVVYNARGAIKQVG